MNCKMEEDNPEEEKSIGTLVVVPVAWASYNVTGDLQTANEFIRQSRGEGTPDLAVMEALEHAGIAERIAIVSQQVSFINNTDDDDEEGGIFGEHKH